MPFWWRRRRKRWYGRYRRPRRFLRYKRRRRRFTKRRNRRAPKRRRRRRYKVRRKKAKLPVYQWQPDSIRKCKIKGITNFVLGAEGTQQFCYTTEKTAYVPPKVPWGGSFGIENFTLKYLYEEYTFHQNIWTASNIDKDLCRYLYCKLEIYRHPDTDFIVAYSRQGPFDLTKFTFPGCHPQQLLLERHKKLIFSKSSKPNGPYRRKLTIKPPKQMISKWFFTKQFTPQILFNLKAAAANLQYSYLSASNESMQVTIYSLNTEYYKTPNWGDAGHTGPYLPYPTMQLPQKYKVKQKDGTLVSRTGQITNNSNYADSIDYTKGWFNSEFLRAAELDNNRGEALAIHQTIAARYNPATDSGVGNEIYCVATTSQNWAPPKTDKSIHMIGMPLWLGFYGLLSYIKKVKDSSFFSLHVIVIKSPAIHCLPEIGGCNLYVPIDWDYMTGTLPYQQTLTPFKKRNWYPTIDWQLKTINSIVETGPFIPNYSEEKNSTWELKIGYQFFFKWGGPQTGDPEVTNPANLQTYDVPDTYTKTIQIKNPAKLSTESILHPWDWRRGWVKEKSLKRMYDYLETDSEFQCSPEKIPKAPERLGAAPRHPQEEEEKMQSCLRYLSEKNICQEEATEQNLQQLINQQQEQQLELKRNILMLLMDLKQKQRMLQLQTGMLE
nr:MAG: ORF1 [Torque teno midi virus]